MLEDDGRLLSNQEIDSKNNLTWLITYIKNLKRALSTGKSPLKSSSLQTLNYAELLLVQSYHSEDSHVLTEVLRKVKDIIVNGNV